MRSFAIGADLDKARRVHLPDGICCELKREDGTTKVVEVTLGDTCV